MNILPNLALTCSLIVFTVHSSMAQENLEGTNELTSRQAVSLLELTVQNQIKDVHPKGRFSLDPMAIERDKRFLSYEALGVWSSKPGSAVIGNYSVNLRTAEVWDLSACRKIEFARLSVLQRRYLSERGLASPSSVGQKNHDAPPSSCQ